MLPVHLVDVQNMIDANFDADSDADQTTVPARAQEALVYVVDRANEFGYAGEDETLDEQAEVIATSAGKNGLNIDYLFEVCHRLESIPQEQFGGQYRFAEHDEELFLLREKVNAIMKQGRAGTAG